MFDLEKEIKDWKRELRANPAFEDGDIAELESHLREQVQELILQGTSDEAAFQEAVQAIGQPASIGNELFKTRATQKSPFQPSWRKLTWLPTLLPNYAKVAFRNLRNDPVYSSVNILALALALAVSLLVITFVKDQASYDTFHQHSERTFRVITKSPEAAGIESSRFASSPSSLGAFLKEDIPEIEEVSLLQPFSGSAEIENNRLKVKGFRVDSSFFRIFNFKLAAGNPKHVLEQLQSIILTKETSERFFGNLNPIGKVIQLSNGLDYEITGVLAATTNRSHLEYDMLLRDNRTIRTSMGMPEQSDWKNPNWYTYVLLNEGANSEAVEFKLQQAESLQYPYAPEEFGFELQPLTEINLGMRLGRQIGRITPIGFVYFLSALAFVILFAACVNYVNLTVARSLKRAKEIGLRKVVGAGRVQLAAQFFSESLVTVLVSLAAGVLLYRGWMLPYWNSLRLATADFGQIARDTINNPELYLIFVAFAVIVGLFSGVYPALRLSSLEPARALKNGSGGGKERGWLMKKFLIISQVALSLVLLISTLLLYRQSNLLLNHNYGFNSNRMINVELGNVDYEAFKNEALNLAGIEKVSAVSALPGVDFPTKMWIGKEEGIDSLRVSMYAVDVDFMNNFNLNLLAGRNFSHDFARDTVQSAIINETAVEGFGFKDPREAVGKYLNVNESDAPLQIVGVVGDVRFDFLWNPISPTVLRYNPGAFSIATLKIARNDQETVLSALTGIWKSLEPVAPLTYHYYTDQIENVYKDFSELVDIIAFLAVLAILMSGFGLLAMAHYDTQNRIKEIGIRKVLGARVESLIYLLSTDFLKLVLVAVIIGLPGAIFLNNLWLQVFSKKAHFGIGVLLFGIFITVAVTMSSIGLQAYRAAYMNPVENLRSE